jgi:hypothetical protein
MGYNASIARNFHGAFRNPRQPIMQSQPLSRLTYASAAPKVGFVSLGCPKALVDSEQILTQLRAEGYETAKSYDGADLVIVNTCGFIDAAVQESLDAIGEALAENGKVIVTGCLGAKKDAAGDDIIMKVHPKVLAVTGPHALAEVMDSVHLHLPKPHEPFFDLVPPQGVKLTPKHYAYLKISEGCNHRCSFCIIPSMRGDLVSRPIADLMLEAENLFKAGVKELLVISQDTSAYGVDVKFRSGFWNGRPVKTHMTQLVEALGELAKSVRRLGAPALCLSVSARRPDHPDDERRPRAALPRHPAAARASRCAQAHEAPGQRREEPGPHPGLARHEPGPDDPLDLHRRLPGRDRGRIRVPAGLPQGSADRPPGLLRLFAGGRRDRQRAGQPGAGRSARRAPRAA